MKYFTIIPIRLIVLLSVQLCFCAVASADSYHVELNGVDSPSRDGKTQPWRTLAFACAHVPANAGHIIEIGTGTFVESAYSIVPPGVSIHGNGITNTILRAAPGIQYQYHSSDTTYSLERFLIQLISPSTTTGNQQISALTIDGVNKLLHGGIVVQHRDDVVITNCKIQYTGITAIWLWDTEGSEVSHCTLTDASFGDAGFQTGNLNLGDVTNTNLFDLTIHSYNFNGTNSWGYGVKAMGPTPPSLSGVKLYDSNIDVSKLGTFLNNGNPIANISLEYHNTSVANCEISNTIVNGNISIVQDSPPTGTTPTIRIYNTTFNLGPDSGSDQRGYSLELCVNNAEIDHNYFNQGYYAIFNSMGKRNHWKIHNNVFENQRYQYIANTIRLQDRGGVGGVDDLEYYNNTILNDGDALNEAGTLTSLEVISVIGNTACTNWKIKNNIIKRTDPQPTYQFRPPQLINLENGATLSSSQVTYNLFDQYPVGSVSGVTYSNNLQTAAGLVWSGTKPVPYFTLTPTSAAIDAGTNVGLPFNGSNPDMGAYETLSSSGTVIDFATQPSGIGMMNPSVYSNVDGNGTSATFANINRYDGSDATPTAYADHSPGGNNRMGIISTNSATITFSAPVTVPGFYTGTMIYGANDGWSVTGSLNGITQFTFNYSYSFPYATWGQVTDGANFTIDKLTWSNAKDCGVDDIEVQPAGSMPTVPEATETYSLRVFPNPASDYVNISFFDNEVGTIDGQIRNMYSVNQQFTKQTEPGENNFSVYVGDLDNGIYIMTLHHGNKRETRKIVISK